MEKVKVLGYKSVVVTKGDNEGSTIQIAAVERQDGTIVKAWCNRTPEPGMDGAIESLKKPSTDVKYSLY